MSQALLVYACCLITGETLLGVSVVVVARTHSSDTTLAPDAVAGFGVSLVRGIGEPRTFLCAGVGQAQTDASPSSTRVSDECVAVETAASPEAIRCTLRESPETKTACVTGPQTTREEGQ